MTAPRKPEPLPPFIAWMSRHGIKVIAALVLLEFLLHGYTLLSSKRAGEAATEAGSEAGSEATSEAATDTTTSPATRR